MKRAIATRKVFAPLKDQKLFEQDSVVDEGRAIRWSDEIDYCADALWMETVEGREAATAAE